MIIRRDKEYLVKVIGALVSIVVMGLVCIFGLNVSIGVFVALYSLIFLYILLFAVAYGRTFVLNAEGCKVCFLWFEKTYLWSELSTKKVVLYPRFSLIPSGDCPYQKYVMFAPYQVWNPMHIRPFFYNLLHPWSYIYINFYIPDPEGKSLLGKATYSGRHYEVREDEFFKKMKQWNVELQ